jgi:uncharacterized repeat protein (TIGR01451 family)
MRLNRALLVSIPACLATGLLVGLLLVVSGAWAAPGVPPEEIYPPRNAVTATLTTTVSATYDEAIDPSTVTSRTFAVHGMESGLVTATHAVSGNTVIVTPTRPFHQGELVYAIATTRTLNLTGTGPASATQWQFNAGRVVSRCAAFVEDSAALGELTGVRDSSVDWGDYDGDGDLDILLTGRDRYYDPLTVVYQNTGGAFTAAYTDTLLDLYHSSAAWGDYDNDGDLDILLTGTDGATPLALVYENTGSGFTEVTGWSLTGVYDGSAAWGDYDNDGDLDFLTTGFDDTDVVAHVYQNTGSGFVTDTVASENLTGVYDGSAAWGDYDDDGDLDILLTGDHLAAVYRNTGSGFIIDTAASQDLPDVYLGSSGVWGDYDNDGDLDVLLTGFNMGYRAEVYENTNGRFSLYTDSLTGVVNGSAAWGDYDNDGDLDILLTGSNNEGPLAEVYENEGDGFRPTEAAHYLTDVDRGSAAWGDYDDDGNLDILLTGEDRDGNRVAKVYENQDCNVDFALTKTADPDPVVAGTGLTYTLVVTNRGNGPIAVLSDTLPPSLTLRTLDQTDNVAGEFDAGTHDNTHWFDPGRWADERLTLSDTLEATGVFTSRVFDAGNDVAWETLRWTPRRPTGKPLPDDGAAETAYALGDVNMVGNRVLLHLDDASAPFTDTSGYGHDSTCTACPATGADGRFNDALAFDGVDDVVTVPDAHDPARYALEAWIYPETVTDTSVILRTDAPTETVASYSHLLGIVDGHFQHTVYDGAHRTVTATTPVTPNRWYHLVGTAQSGGDLTLYVDGEREAQMSGLGSLWAGGDHYRLGSPYVTTSITECLSGTVQIPCTVTDTTATFDGRLDEVAVYSRTLSAAEVTDHYLRGALHVAFQVRLCEEPDCTGRFRDWRGPYSEASNASLGLPGVTLPPLPETRYAQYRATLTTDDPAYAPELRRVALGPDHYDVTADPPSQCAATGRAFTCTLDALPAGNIATVTARTHVNHAALGPITNTAGVTATGELTPETALTDNVVTATTQVTSEVELQIRKYDDDRDLPYWHDATYGMADPVNPGSPLTATLLVHNDGPSTAWDVTVTDTLPITPTAVLTPAGWRCETVGQALTCTAEALPPWSWDAILLTGAAPTVSGTITNTAAITAAGSIVDPGSSLSDTITTTVIPLADLSVAKTVTPDPVDPGETLTFTVHVTNTGPYTATGLVVTDTLPADVTEITALDDTACRVEGVDVVCEPGGELTPTASTSFQLTATAPLSGLIENHAIVTSDVFDPDLEDNEITRFVAVRPVADLSVVKRDAPDPVDAAAPLTYTLTVSNAGPVDAGALTTTVSARANRNIRVPIGGTARPYPSTLWLNSVPGRVREITVTLYGLHHTYPADVVALLTGPGASTMLMANAGGGTDADDLALTFHETGAALPDSEPLTSTTYRPTNHGFGESLPDPAPAGAYGSGFSPFHDTSPNGAWRLYVYDTYPSDGGYIADGWGLDVVAVTTDTVTVSDTLPASLTGPIVTAPTGWGCTTGDEVLCEGDRLNRRETLTLTLAATAPITPGVITNTAHVTSTLADFDRTRNTDRITTTVAPVADLGIAKTATPAPLVPQGHALTYTLAITNAGPSPLLDTIIVTDALPAVLDPVNVTAPGWTCETGAVAGNARPLTCTIDGLTVGPAPPILVATTAPTATDLVLRNVAGVTAEASDEAPLDNHAAVSVTVGDVAITGLSATNDSPTAIGTPTYLEASVATGTNVVYTWAFGDGALGTGNPVSHTYSATGSFTAIVTATNSISQLTTTTAVEIVEWYRVYLPLVARNYAAAPDLVVESLVATSNAVTVTIRNDGDAPVDSLSSNEFWTDVYVAPTTPPTHVNQTWQQVGDQGLVWGVTRSALPLAPGDALTLTLDGPYYRPDESEVTWPLAEGTPVYAQVDSANEDTGHGAVRENHEIIETPYNNVTGPSISTAGGPAALSSEGGGPIEPGHLPPRP